MFVPNCKFSGKLKKTTYAYVFVFITHRHDGEYRNFVSLQHVIKRHGIPIE